MGPGEDGEAHGPLQEVGEEGEEAQAASQGRPHQEDAQGLAGDGDRGEGEGEGDLGGEGHEEASHEDEEEVPGKGPLGPNGLHKRRVGQHLGLHAFASFPRPWRVVNQAMGFRLTCQGGG